MENVWKALASNREAMLVTVVARRGSAPRGPGAMMLLSDGVFTGTIGGGAVEFAAQQEARALLAAKQGGRQRYSLSNDQAAGLGMVCGGEVEVFFTYLPPSHGLTDGAPFLRLTPQGAEAADGAGLPTEPTLTGDVFTMPLSRPGQVYLFGGGHVARALVPALAAVEFSVVVLEDRPEFLNPDHFPDAAGLETVDFDRLPPLALTARDACVVMTRGHQSDFAVLRQVLPSPAGYVGCMGSRAKAAHTRQRLLELGVAPARVAALRTPIGLAIGAQTPAEIAVSIAAELIAWRAGANP